MRTILFSVLLLSCAGTTAHAREGFSISFGLGESFWSFDKQNIYRSLKGIPDQGNYGLLANNLSDGLALRFAMAYNILGWVSPELGITAHGWNLGKDTLGGSGQVTMVLHFHPLKIWFPERPYDATVYLGGGFSLVGGGNSDNDFNRGLSGGALETGFTGRWYFTPWFSLALDFRFTVPFYSRWYQDWGDNIDYAIDNSPDMFVFSLLLCPTFHFSAAQ